MQAKHYFLLTLLIVIVLGAVGCGDQQNVVKSANKTGLNAEDRKDKRGD